MAACEKCWADWRRRQMFQPDLNYSDVVAERELLGPLCTLAEQCGDVHVICVEVGGVKQCRCGVRQEEAAQTTETPR